jgi:hypothetical protein
MLRVPVCCVGARVNNVYHWAAYFGPGYDLNRSGTLEPGKTDPPIETPTLEAAVLYACVVAMRVAPGQPLCLRVGASKVMTMYSKEHLLELEARGWLRWRSTKHMVNIPLLSAFLDVLRGPMINDRWVRPTIECLQDREALAKAKATFVPLPRPEEEDVN